MAFAPTNESQLHAILDHHIEQFTDKTFHSKINHLDEESRKIWPARWDSQRNIDNINVAANRSTTPAHSIPNGFPKPDIPQPTTASGYFVHNRNHSPPKRASFSHQLPRSPSPPHSPPPFASNSHQQYSSNNQYNYVSAPTQPGRKYTQPHQQSNPQPHRPLSPTFHHQPPSPPQPPQPRPPSSPRFNHRPLSPTFHHQPPSPPHPPHFSPPSFHKPLSPPHSPHHPQQYSNRTNRSHPSSHSAVPLHHHNHNHQHQQPLYYDQPAQHQQYQYP